MRILLVEDESDAAAVLAKGLREHAYAVDVASDGPQALDLAAANDYDLVVLDLLLPRIDGLEVCRRLRAEGWTTPILMLTARGEPDQRVEGLDAGADDYLPKPYHFPERFYRVDVSRGSRDGGAGLGLALVRWVAGLHGGNVTLRTHQEIEFSVRNLAPGTSVTFLIDGQAIGQASVDRRGRAELEVDVPTPRAAASR